MKIPINPGDKFGNWTVLYEEVVRDWYRNVRYMCLCEECGTTKSFTGVYLKKRTETTCYCPSKIETRVCPVCKKEFQVKSHDSKKYCSRECGYRNAPKRPTQESLFTTLICDYCKKPFKRKKCEVSFRKQHGSKHDFCCGRCQQQYFKGNRSASWKGGISRAYQFGYHTKAYKDWRTKVFTKDNYTCQVCNKVGGYLHAHHKRGFTHNPELRFDVSNGITLCKKCHWEVHSLKCDNLNQNKMIQELRLDAMVIKDSRKRKTVKKHYNQNALDFGVSAL